MTVGGIAVVAALVTVGAGAITTAASGSEATVNDTTTTLSLSATTAFSGAGPTATVNVQLASNPDPIYNQPDAIVYGSVQLQADGANIGPMVSLVAGKTIISQALSGLPPGTYSVTATYQPYQVTSHGLYSYKWNSSTSAPVTLTVAAHTNVWTFAAFGASNQLLEANASSSGNGAVVDTWATTMSGTNVQANETWKAVADSTNPSWYRLINEGTGKCLEVNATTGAVDQWDCVAGAANELWQYGTLNLGDGKHGNLLQVKSSGAYLAVNSLTAGNGTGLRMQTSQSNTTGWIGTEQP